MLILSAFPLWSRWKKKKMPELKANTAYLRPFGELVWTKMIRTKLWVSLVAHIVRICLQCRRPGFYFWVGKIPWKRERLPTPVFLPGEFHGEISLVLQSMGSQTVVYNWATNTHTHTHTHTHPYYSEGTEATRSELTPTATKQCL